LRALTKEPILIEHVLVASYYLSKYELLFSKIIEKKSVSNSMVKKQRNFEQHDLVKHDFANEITFCYWQIGQYLSSHQMDEKKLSSDSTFWAAIRYARMSAPREIRTLGQRYIDPKSTQHFFLEGHPMGVGFLEWYDQNPKYVEKLDRLVCTLNETESPREFRKAWNTLMDEITHKPEAVHFSGPTRKPRAHSLRSTQIHAQI
jgi:hypothetical protein